MGYSGLLYERDKHKWWEPEWGGQSCPLVGVGLDPSEPTRHHQCACRGSVDVCEVRAGAAGEGGLRRGLFLHCDRDSWIEEVRTA